MNNTLFKHTGLIFIGIVGLNLLLKGLFLGYANLHMDEAFSAFWGQMYTKDILTMSKHEANPPLYVIFMRFWMRFAGNSEVALRLPSLIANALTAGLLYVFAKYRLKNAKIGVLAALLFTFSTVQVYYAQEARNYAISLFLLLLSIDRWWVLMRGKSMYSNAVCLFILNMILLYLHYLFGFAFLVQFFLSIALFKTHRKQVIIYLLSQVLVFISFLPWLKVMLTITQNQTVTGWVKAPSVYDVIEGLSFFTNTSLGLLTIVLGYGIGIYHTYQQKKQKDLGLWLIVGLTFIPLICILLTSQRITLFNKGYYLATSLGISLGVAYFIFQSKLNVKIQYGLASGVLILFMVTINLKPLKNMQFGEAMPTVQSYIKKNTGIIISAGYKANLFMYYYDKKRFEDYKVMFALPKQGIFPVYNPDTFLDTVPLYRYENIVYVNSEASKFDPKGKIRHVLATQYTPTHSRSFLGVTVENFDIQSSIKPLPKTYYQDFEDALMTNKSTVAFKGKYSQLLDEQHIYSAGLERKLSDLVDKPITIQVSFWAYTEQTESQIKVVFSSENILHQTQYWKGLPFNQLPTKKWTQFHLTHTLPPSKYPLDILKTYILLDSKQKVWIDNLYISIL